MSTTKVRKERFEERHGVSAGKYAAQTAAFAKQISDHDRNKKYVLHPMKNKFLNYWDVVSTIALLWTATVTPFEASFLSPAFGPSAWTEVWYLMNRVLDLVFCIDMLLQFFIAYEELDDRGGKLWVDDHPRVIKHYVRTWFALDAATIFVPGGFDFYLASIPDAPAATASNSTGGEASASEDSAVTFAANMSILRVLRIIRLVKLVRLVRASRLWTRWKTKISLSYGAQTSLTCISMMLFGAHWYACIMALEASLHESPQDTWLGVRRYSFCDDLEPVTLNVGDGDTVGTTLQGSISSTGITDCDMMGVGSWYLAAFSWSVMIITGTGGTDFYPSSVSDSEGPSPHAARCIGPCACRQLPSRQSPYRHAGSRTRVHSLSLCRSRDVDRHHSRHPRRAAVDARARQVLRRGDQLRSRAHRVSSGARRPQRFHSRKQPAKGDGPSHARVRASRLCATLRNARESPCASRAGRRTGQCTVHALSSTREATPRRPRDDEPRNPVDTLLRTSPPPRCVSAGTCINSRVHSCVSTRRGRSLASRRRSRSRWSCTATATGSTGFGSSRISTSSAACALPCRWARRCLRRARWLRKVYK